MDSEGLEPVDGKIQRNCARDQKKNVGDAEYGKSHVADGQERYQGGPARNESQGAPPFLVYGKAYTLANQVSDAADQDKRPKGKRKSERREEKIRHDTSKGQYQTGRYRSHKRAFGYVKGR